ncbi:MAG: hypothetical protein LBQ75_09380 [Zoogloeaceae bacterium]|jgi:hypothetical protein|nr:hypothetical protein [Zoogloeaceae bacterium]
MQSPGEADDLAVLFPDVAVEIAGETLTMRELRFGEQLKYHAILARVADALKPAAQSQDALNLILDALAEEHDAILTLVSVCCGKPVEWIQGLSSQDGERLLSEWWVANHGFFVRRVARATLAGAWAANHARAADGDASLPPLSGTDTTGAN